jgi:hypothetical protein
MKLIKYDIEKVDMKLPIEIIDLIYSFTNFKTALQHHCCSQYIIDKLFDEKNIPDDNESQYYYKNKVELLLDNICEKTEETIFKLPVPQEINDMIYSFTNFTTALEHNCSNYVLDSFVSSNYCVYQNIYKTFTGDFNHIQCQKHKKVIYTSTYLYHHFSEGDLDESESEGETNDNSDEYLKRCTSTEARLRARQGTCICENDCCFEKELSLNIKYKIFMYAKNKNSYDYQSFNWKNSLNINTLTEFILSNKIFVKILNIKTYDKISDIYSNYKLNNLLLYSKNYNIIRILYGMNGLSYSS